MAMDMTKPLSDSFALPCHPQQRGEVVLRFGISRLPVHPQVALGPGEDEVEMLAVLVCREQGDDVQMPHPLEHADFQPEVFFLSIDFLHSEKLVLLLSDVGLSHHHDLGK